MSENVPRSKLDTIHEHINELRYPIEYFVAQVAFAKRWSEISGEPLADSLQNRTLLARRLDDGLTEDLTTGMTKDVDVGNMTQAYYAHYAVQESARYEPDVPGDHVPHEGYGFFSYDYYPNNSMDNGRNLIKIHFMNNLRGEKSGLAAEFLERRKQDVRYMIADVLRKHPETDGVIGGSWLYNLPAYLDSFPAEFVASIKPLVPPELAGEYPDAVPNMSFRGNSIWGQFIDRYGWVARERYEGFMQDIEGAKTLPELYEAIPLKPLQPNAPPSVFLD